MHLSQKSTCGFNGKTFYTTFTKFSPLISNFSCRKLLKEHESKYEPLGHDESFNIMEEILAMQIGLNADQVIFFHDISSEYLH